MSDPGFLRGSLHRRPLGDRGFILPTSLSCRGSQRLPILWGLLLDLVAVPSNRTLSVFRNVRAPHRLLGPTFGVQTTESTNRRLNGTLDLVMNREGITCSTVNLSTITECGRVRTTTDMGRGKHTLERPFGPPQDTRSTRAGRLFSRVHPGTFVRVPSHPHPYRRTVRGLSPKH